MPIGNRGASSKVQLSVGVGSYKTEDERTWFTILLVRFSAKPASADLSPTVTLLSVLAVSFVLVVEGNLFALLDHTSREKANAKLAINGPLYKIYQVLDTGLILTKLDQVSLLWSVKILLVVQSTHQKGLGWHRYHKYHTDIMRANIRKYH